MPSRMYLKSIMTVKLLINPLIGGTFGRLDRCRQRITDGDATPIHRWRVSYINISDRAAANANSEEKWKDCIFEIAFISGVDTGVDYLLGHWLVNITTIGSQLPCICYKTDGCTAPSKYCALHFRRKYWIWRNRPLWRAVFSTHLDSIRKPRISYMLYEITHTWVLTAFDHILLT